MRAGNFGDQCDRPEKVLDGFQSGQLIKNLYLPLVSIKVLKVHVQSRNLYSRTGKYFSSNKNLCRNAYTHPALLLYGQTNLSQAHMKRYDLGKCLYRWHHYTIAIRLHLNGLNHILYS